MKKRLFILGLDCATPQLIFDRFFDELPCLAKIISLSKEYGLLRSTDPPVTIPAWMSMFTGKDPGQLGFYGFTDRLNYSYNETHIVNSNDLEDKTVWDYLSEKGLESIVISVPQTYPPKPIKGILISGFLTPDKRLPFTYPREIQKEVEDITQGYIFDVENFMMRDKKKILSSLYEMTRKRFKLAKEFLVNKKWDMFVMVEIAVDRLHHSFWRYCFSEHRLFRKGNKFESAILDYYKFIDKEISELLSLLPEDAVLMIVSDHGAKSSKGTFHLNDWLVQNGYLHLKRNVKKKENLNTEDIDWFKTTAWAKGGYYGRIFLNLKGRERYGIVPPNQADKLKKEIARKLAFLSGPSRERVKNIIKFPEKIYKDTKNFPPDMIFYCGELDWRVSNSVGNKSLFSTEEQSEADNANHDFNGIFIISLYPKEINKRNIKLRKKDLKSLKKYSILSIAPTILNFFDIKIPKGLSGKVIKIN